MIGEMSIRGIIIVFEGRDAAGKGGTIKAVTERVSPRASATRAKGQAQLPTWPRLERRHQTIRLRDRHWNPTSVASFRRRRPSPYERNAAISRHFERDPISHALETDWPVGAAGFEPLHLEIESAELHPASTGFRRRSGAPLIRDAQVRVPPPG